MAKQTVALDVTLNSQQAEQSVGSFKKQLREANAELIQMSEQFGAASTEAVTAAKKVAGLKDAIGDAKALAETFNPDKKFVALGGALQGATAGFSALQGAMGLFGAEGEQINEMLLKVQAAMALQQGIAGVTGALDSFKLLGAEIMRTTVFQKANTAATIVASQVQKAFGASVIGTGRAFNVLKGAIFATGIGALIVGIGMLVQKIMEWTDDTENQEQAQNRLNAALETQKQLLKDEIDGIEFVSKARKLRAQIAGETEEQITKIEQQAIDDRIAALNRDRQAKEQLQQSEAYKRGTPEYRKKINDELLAADDTYYKALNEKSLNNLNVELNNKKAKEEADKKALEKRKENNDKALALEKQYRQLENELDLELRRRNKSKLDLELIELEEQYKKRLELAKGNAALIAEVEYAYRRERADAINADFVERVETEKVQENQISTIKIDGANLTNAALEAARQSDIANTKAAHEIKMLLNEQQIEAASAVGDALGNLANLIGKQTGVGKALAVAQATISTIISAQQAYQRGIEVPYIGMVLGPINAAIAVASGIANVKKILSVQVPGAAGGGGSTPNISASAARAPIAPQAQSTRLDQNQVNQIGSAVSARAYVLESDGASAQERRVRIERAARIN